jgi:hypothetical protein
MKKLLIIVLVSGLALSASAQKFIHGGGYYRGPRVIVSAGLFPPLYPYYGYPFFPYGSYGYMQRPTRLDMKISDIKNDYRDRIWSARHDKSLPRHERKQNVHQLKHDRDEAIIQARRNYYKTKVKPAE